MLIDALEALEKDGGGDGSGRAEPVIVRRERQQDVVAIAAVTRAAFLPSAGGGEPVEVGLVEALRSSDAWLPALSLVAVAEGDEVIGHVLCTRAHVGDEPALGLGPLSVRPDWQRRGVGSALMHAVLGAAEALGEPVVVLLGSPGYYGRFGFGPAAACGITPPVPEWRGAFQVRVLARPLAGPFAYARPFMEL